MSERYPNSMIALHWLLALLIIAAFFLGLTMVDMRISPTKLQYYSYHKWLGVTTLVLVAVRLLVRLRSVQPAHPAHMQAWEKMLASGTHVLLYILMFAVPMSGYLHSSAAGYPVVYLGLIELPTLIAPNPELKSTFKLAHEVMSKGMLILVILHIAAALKHQFLDRDNLLARMKPVRSTKEST